LNGCVIWVKDTHPEEGYPFHCGLFLFQEDGSFNSFENVLETCLEYSNISQMLETFKKDSTKKRKRTEFEMVGLNTWDNFCKKISPNKEYQQLKFAKGHDGLGVIIHADDGEHTIIGNFNKDNKITSVTIDFNNGPSQTTKEIGVIGSDSGKLTIVDPCYILS